MDRTVMAHLKAGHLVFEDTRGWQGFEFRLEGDEIQQQDSGYFVADDSGSEWGCRDCRIDGGLEAPSNEMASSEREG